MSKKYDVESAFVMFVAWHSILNTKIYKDPKVKNYILNLRGLKLKWKVCSSYIPLDVISIKFYRSAQ